LVRDPAGLGAWMPPGGRRTVDRQHHEPDIGNSTRSAIARRTRHGGHEFAALVKNTRTHLESGLTRDDAGYGSTKCHLSTIRALAAAERAAWVQIPRRSLMTPASRLLLADPENPVQPI